MRVLIPEEKEHSAGEVIGYIIGVLYFFGIIYYLYRIHLLSLFQMFMNYLDVIYYNLKFRIMKMKNNINQYFIVA